MTSAFLLTVWLAASAAAGPSEGLLADAEAMEHFQAAQDAFNKGDYARASTELEKAFLIEPADALLYPWAQAERFRGRCEVAVDLYRKFLDTEPSENFRVAATENLERCEEEVAAKQPAVVEEGTVGEKLDDGWDEVAQGADQETQPPPPTPKDRQAKKWYLDPIGGVLCGVGLAGVATGGALLGVSSSRAGKVADEPTNDAYLDARQSATNLRNGGLIALSLGGALIIGGAVRYALLATRSKGQSASVWVGPRGTAGVVFSRRF